MTQFIAQVTCLVFLSHPDHRPRKRSSGAMPVWGLQLIDLPAQPCSGAPFYPSRGLVYKSDSSRHGPCLAPAVWRRCTSLAPKYSSLIRKGSLLFLRKLYKHLKTCNLLLSIIDWRKATAPLSYWNLSPHHPK